MPEAGSGRARGARAFWPALLLGTGGAALASVGAGRDWADASAQVAGASSAATVSGSDVAPLALALALVALAAWGAVLVVRRRARRFVAVVGLLAATGVLVTVAASGDRARTEALASLAGTAKDAEAGLTGWYVVTLVGAALAALAFVVALLNVSEWPEMGTRYDAPGTQDKQPEQRDLWKALDEGHDPTV